jgi:hypothetical protein
MSGTNQTRGRIRLAKLANDARPKGFELIAREASVAAASRGADYLSRVVMDQS